MFSLNQIYLLNMAKEDGKEWLATAYDDAMEDIRLKIEDADLFTLFRMELFNQREPCVILEIDRKMTMRHPLMDPVDVHKILLENDGYEKLAEEMEDVKLAYKVSDDSKVIKLKLEFRPRPLMPVLPASDDEEEKPTKCCHEGCTNDSGWYDGPCTGCYLRSAADEPAPKRHCPNPEEEERVMWDKEYRRNGPAGFPASGACIIPDCLNMGVNGGMCEECTEHCSIYDQVNILTA